ncbi:MAG: hypothetical protein TECD_01028 [Hyphomicrobiaceae bacterium hypho_1]
MLFVCRCNITQFFEHQTYWGLICTIKNAVKERFSRILLDYNYICRVAISLISVFRMKNINKVFLLSYNALVSLKFCKCIIYSKIMLDKIFNDSMNKCNSYIGQDVTEPLNDLMKRIKNCEVAE